MAMLEIDASQVAGMAELFKKAEREAPAAIGRAVRRTGQMTRTQVVRTLTTQTGLKRDVINRAVKEKTSGGMTYALVSRGGNVSLKYFKARETAKGVTAAPWNSRRLYAGAFIFGGKRPHRVGLPFGGQVMQRSGASRLPIHKLKSGLFIPREMVSGASKAAFLIMVASVLPDRLRHEIGAILKGHA